MNKSFITKFRPLLGHCLGLCTGTLILGFSSCVIVYETIHRHGESEIIWLLPALIAILHLVFVAFSIWKWNAWIYLYDDSVVQTQWGRKVVIPYADIQDIRFGAASSTHLPKIALYSNGQKILLDSSKIDIFRKYCTNKEINNKIDAWQNLWS